MKNKRIGWMCVFVIVATCFSCTRYNMEQLYPASGCAMDTNGTISFSKQVIPIFKSQCATAGCHSGNNPAGNLDLDSAVAYMQLADSRAGYIDTVHPSTSLLYSQLVSATNPMPPTGKLDPCTTTLILKWMQQKASNN